MNKQSEKEELIPMIVQDVDSGMVLSLVYANAQSLRKMRSSGYVWRYSRKQDRVIRKGDTSGNTQKVVAMSWDCDRDSLLVRVRPEGPACHTGKFSCFGGEKPTLIELVEVIKDRRKNPTKGSYTSSIVNNRKKIIAKLREECEELIEARGARNIIWEAADLLYFMLVYLENRRMSWTEVLKELRRRREQNARKR